MNTIAENNKFKLTDLPYNTDALEPHISSTTIETHYGKHHAGYVKKLNAAIEGTNHEGVGLEELVSRTAGKPELSGIFNNAAQVYNHDFYFAGMSPQGGGQPSGNLAQKINEDFGSFEKFTEDFKKAAATNFGSGWTWLVVKDGKLDIMNTGNAETPLMWGAKPLITIDVWEHAYYLDYKNERPGYIDSYLTHLVNWKFAEKNYDNA